ncbi:MAG: helix-turn-helix domain-containing protein [Polyangiaceae bacterium]
MSANVGRSRADQKQKTRAELLEAGRRVFEERGFSAAQIGEIAKAAGVAHGTFYVHFKSKELLLDELLHDFNVALVKKLARAWPTGGEGRGPEAVQDPMAAAAKLAEICLDHWRSERGLMLAFAQRAGADGKIESLRDGINPEVGLLLAERLSALSGAPRADAELVAQALLGMWTRIGMQHLFGNVSRARAVSLLSTLSVGAIAAALPGLGTSKEVTS